MHARSKLVLAVVAALALVTVPLAVASPGSGKGHARSAHGDDGAAHAEAHRAARADGTRDAADDGNASGPNATGRDRAKPFGDALRGDRGAEASNASASNHTGLHKGWLKIQEKMPERFRAWWAFVLHGMSVREAKASSSAEDGPGASASSSRAARHA